MRTTPPPPLAGRRALVTGGARRLGRTIVKALADAGAAVAIHHHASGAEAASLAARLGVAGARVAVLQADLADPAGVVDLLAAADRQLGQVDILVNSAASFAADDLATSTWDDWCSSLALDAWAPFALGRAFADGRAGAVVNLLDARIAGDPDPAHLSYALAKAALAGLTRTCARAFAPRVRVNAVAPGPVLPPPGGAADDLARLAAGLPTGRSVSSAAVGAAVVHLAAAEDITGQVLFVDGGAHLGGSP